MRRIFVKVASSAVVAGALSAMAVAQEQAGPAVQLEPYTAPDQSASAGVPPGWQVTRGEQSVIVMTGPQGETIFLGSAAVARNGPFRPALRNGGVDLSMPYGADLAQKFTMLLQHNAAVSGTAPPQIKITSATPIQVPPVLGQCARILANVTGTKGPMAVGSLFCSSPIDSGGIYKNFFKLAQVPAGMGEQERPTIRAVFASYRVPLPMLQRKLAPFTPPPVVQAGPGYMPAMPDSTGAECFDLVVIRETPSYDLPRKCGGHAPD